MWKMNGLRKRTTYSNRFALTFSPSLFGIPILWTMTEREVVSTIIASTPFTLRWPAMTWKRREQNKREVRTVRKVCGTKQSMKSLKRRADHKNENWLYILIIFHDMMHWKIFFIKLLWVGKRSFFKNNLNTNIILIVLFSPKRKSHEPQQEEMIGKE